MNVPPAMVFHYLVAIFTGCMLHFSSTYGQLRENDGIEKLITQWAPLVWLAPEEKYMPLSVEHYIENVYASSGSGDKNEKIAMTYNLPTGSSSKSLYLVTKKDIDTLMTDKESFLYGKNPKKKAVPVYALVTECSSYYSFRSSDLNSLRNDLNVLMEQVEPSPTFHVTYWIFYPYNEGKEVCFIGKVPTPIIFNTCFGHRRLIGNHVGDWEHMSLSFRGRSYPSDMFVAVHDAGVYYKYDINSRLFKYNKQVIRKGIVQKPKFPPIVRVSNGHPVLFAAYGSHGLWSAPGEHYYVRIPRLNDKNGYGIPWQTWKNVQIIYSRSDDLPNWLNYRGKWGNPQDRCYLLKKLGICDLWDGPSGILDKRENFSC